MEKKVLMLGRCPKGSDPNPNCLRDFMFVFGHFLRRGGDFRLYFMTFTCWLTKKHKYQIFRLFVNLLKLLINLVWLHYTTTTDKK